MKFVPRFLTDGRAVALSGYVHRVNGRVIRQNLATPSAAAALGGSFESKQGRYSFPDDANGDAVVSLRSSSLNTWHDREDQDDSGQHPTHTVHAKSSIEQLSVGNRFFVDRASAYLRTVYREGDVQPAITPVEADLDGLVIDGVRFTVTLDTAPLSTFATCNDFHHAAMHDSRFKETHGERVLSLRDPSASGPSGKGCFVCSVVERIEWEGALPQGAEVDEDSHVIVWPDFGTVILGEVLIADFSRRLTMVRLELGSPIVASIAAADVQSGGQGLP